MTDIVVKDKDTLTRIYDYKSLETNILHQVKDTWEISHDESVMILVLHTFHFLWFQYQPYDFGVCEFIH